MATTVNANALAGDSRALDALRTQARQAPDQALKKAAQQFEALFMQMVMKSMRDALPKEDMLGSDASRTWTGMLDQQFAQNISGKGIGLADMMVKQLRRNEAPKVEAAVKEAKQAQLTGDTTPQAFVQKLSGAAGEASKGSGIPAHFMLGQAALESGWGKREIRMPDGSPSHNLFGIKAGESWKGRTVEATTTEYVNGQPRKQVERFRAYASYDEAFKDYARLIGGSKRYANAVQETQDAARFAQRIQSAGYATDPRYAEKLTKTINRTLALGGAQVAGRVPA